MAIKIIPVRFDSPDFNFQIDLDGAIYGFRFVLNTRTNRYSVTILTETGELIVAGVALTSNWKPFGRFKDLRLPPGRFFTMDTTGENQEPNEDNFGDTVLFCYEEALA